MINLLPSQNKKELLVEEAWKTILTLMMISVFFLAVLTLVLLLVDITLLSNLEIQKIGLGDPDKAPDVLRTKSLENDLTDFNQTVAGLENFYRNQFMVADTLEQISALLISSSLTLTNFSFAIFKSPQEDDSIGQVSLVGFAAKRDSLLQFKKKLEQTDNINSVSFPASNWVKPVNIQFTATFKVNDNQKKD